MNENLNELFWYWLKEEANKSDYKALPIWLEGKLDQFKFEHYIMNLNGIKT